MAIIRSRIKENISQEVMEELFDICKKKSISDNNKKVQLIEQVLLAHGIDYHMLGPGTNRVAVLIDKYVFKIAMDDWGLQDNRNEFTNSYELQPFVIKTYEVDQLGLISVCEYVSLLSREEFMENQLPILKNLSVLGESYLLGDVGYTPKNFTNWGVRRNGDLVILDFAYIYQISTDIIRCSKDEMILEYNHNFTGMSCPRCHAKYSFMDIRRRIPREFEHQQNELELRESYMLKDESFIEVEDDDDDFDGSEYRITRSDVFGVNEQNDQQNTKVDKEEETPMLSEEEIQAKHEAIRERLERQYQTGHLDEVTGDAVEEVETSLNAYVDPAEFRKRLALKEMEDAENQRMSDELDDVEFDDEDGIDIYDLPVEHTTSEYDANDLEDVNVVLDPIERNDKGGIDVVVQTQDENTVVSISVGDKEVITDSDTVEVTFDAVPDGVKEAPEETEDSIILQHYTDGVKEAPENLVTEEPTDSEEESTMIAYDQPVDEDGEEDEEDLDLRGKFFGSLADTEEEQEEETVPSDEEIARAYAQGVNIQVANEIIKEDADKWHSEPEEIVEHLGDEHLQEEIEGADLVAEAIKEEAGEQEQISDEDLAKAYLSGNTESKQPEGTVLRKKEEIDENEPAIGEDVLEDDDSDERYLRPLTEDEVDIGKPDTTNPKRKWTL